MKKKKINRSHISLFFSPFHFAIEGWTEEEEKKCKNKQTDEKNKKITDLYIH